MKKRDSNPNWVRFNPSGFLLHESAGLSAEEVGAHILLWSMSLTGDYGGRLPNDDTDLARTAHLTLARWKRIKPKLQRLWRVEKNRFVSDFARFEYNRSQERLKAAQKGGKTSARNRLCNQVDTQVEFNDGSTPVPTTVSRAETNDTNERTTRTKEENDTSTNDRTNESRGSPAIPDTVPTPPGEPSSSSLTAFSIPSIRSSSSPGLTPPRELMIRPDVLKRVGDAMKTAAEGTTGKPWVAPDQSIVQRVYEAGNGASADEIVTALGTGGFTPMENYAFFVRVVETRCKRHPVQASAGKRGYK